MVKVEGEEIRCSRCDDHMFTWDGEKVVLMQHSLIQRQKGKILDVDNNEITDGKVMKCDRCTLRQNVNEFSVEDVVGRPVEREKLETKKSMKWMQNQMMLDRREPKISPSLVSIGNELWPFYKVKIVDEGVTKQGIRIAVHEYETKNYKIRLTGIEEPGQVLAQKEDRRCLTILLGWLVVEQRTEAISTTPYYLQKLLAIKKPGGSRWKRVLDTLKFLHHSYYEIADKKNRNKLILGHFIDRIERGVFGEDDTTLRIYVNKGWMEDSYKLINDELGRYLGFPSKEIMKLGLSPLYRNFGFWLARQKGKDRANIGFGNLLRMGYSESTMSTKLNPKKKWQIIKDCLIWAGNNGFYKGKYHKGFSKVVSGYFKVIDKNDQKLYVSDIDKNDEKLNWSTIDDWVVFAYPRGKKEKREGIPLTLGG